MKKHKHTFQWYVQNAESSEHHDPEYPTVKVIKCNKCFKSLDDVIFELENKK